MWELSGQDQIFGAGILVDSSLQLARAPVKRSEDIGAC